MNYINWGLVEMKMKNIKLTNKRMAELLGIGIATWNRYRTNASDIPFQVFCNMLDVLDLKFDNIVNVEVF